MADADAEADAEELAAKGGKEKIGDRFNNSPRLVFGLTFTVGLFLGWLVIGWLIWPIKWTNTDLWDLRPEHQMLYIRMVADQFWDTGDTRLIYEALDGWDRQALAELLAKMMQSNELPAESRQRLVALADSLELATYEQPLLAFLFFNHTAIFITAILSLLPMLLAVSLAVAPAAKKYTSEEGRAQLAEAFSGALFGDDEDEDEDEGSEWQLLFDEEGEAIFKVDEEGNPVSGTDGKPIQKRKRVPKSSVAGLDAIYELDDEVLVEDADEYAEGQYQGVQSILGGPGAAEEQSIDVGDVLSSVFEDDDEDLEKLETLAEQLDDVTIEDLLSLTRKVIQELALMVA